MDFCDIIANTKKRLSFALIDFAFLQNSIKFYYEHSLLVKQICWFDYDNISFLLDCNCISLISLIEYQLNSKPFLFKTNSYKTNKSQQLAKIRLQKKCKSLRSAAFYEIFT